MTLGWGGKSIYFSVFHEEKTPVIIEYCLVLGLKNC